MTSRVKLRTTPGQEPEPPSEVDLQVEANELARANAEEVAATLGDGDLEDWLEDLTPAQASQYVVYIYRTEPLPKNVRSVPLYRNRPLPVDSEGFPDLRGFLAEDANGGGGAYQVHVKYPGKGRRDDVVKGILRIPGAPKMAAAPPVLDASTGLPAASGAPAAAATGQDALSIGLAIADRMNARNEPAPDPMATIGNTVRAMKGLQEEFLPKQSAADPLESARSAVGLAKDIAAMLTPAQPAVAAAAPLSPLDQLKMQWEFDDLMRRRYTPAAPPAAPPAAANEPAGGAFGTGMSASDLAELSKGPLAEAVKDSIRGAKGWSEVGAEFAGGLITHPGVLNEVAGFIKIGLAAITSAIAGRMAPTIDGGAAAASGQKQLAAGGTTSQAAAHTDAAKPAQTAHSAEGSEGAQALAEMQPFFDQMLPLLSEAFNHEADGTETAEQLYLGAPQFVAPLAQIFRAVDDINFLAFLRRQPAIASDTRHVRFTQFYADFKMRILDGFADDGDFTAPDGAQGDANAEPDAAAPFTVDDGIYRPEAADPATV